MSWCAFASVSLLLVVSQLPRQALAQTADGGIENIVGRDLATWILIGVAGLFAVITALCFCLVLCTCYYNHKRARERQRKSVYKGLHLNLDSKEAPSVSKEQESCDTKFIVEEKRESSSSSDEEAESDELRDDDDQEILKDQHLKSHDEPQPSPLELKQATLEGPSSSKTNRTRMPIRKRSNARFHGPRFKNRSNETSMVSIHETDGWVKKNPGFVARRSTSRPVNLLLLQQELSPVSQKWLNIGVHLKVPMKTLQNIKMIHAHDSEKCLMMVAEEWLRIEKFPSWLIIANVLKTRIISEMDLAAAIQTRYCKSPPTSDDEKSEEEEESSSVDLEGEFDTSVTLI